MTIPFQQELDNLAIHLIRELYTGGTESETKYLFDIFPEGKTGDSNLWLRCTIYNDEFFTTTRDTMLLNALDGFPPDFSEIMC